MPSYDKSDLQRRMHGAVEALKHDLGGLRTGRASTALLDPVQVAEGKARTASTSPTSVKSCRSSRA